MNLVVLASPFVISTKRSAWRDLKKSLLILFGFCLVVSDIIRIFATERRRIGSVFPSFFEVFLKLKTA